MTIASRGRTPILAALIIVAALALAACGSSAATDSHSATTAAAASAAASGGGTFNRAKFRACLKSHGVTLPARRPGAGAAGPPPGAQSGSQSSSKRPRGFFGFGGGGAFANPKLRAAIQACGGARFRGAGARRFALSHAAVLKFIACVNKHGYKLPTPNFSGKGSIFPAGIRRNAKFEKAARSCASLLRPPGPPPGGAAPPAGSSSSTSGA